jgi:signal transduction histidine kinase
VRTETESDALRLRAALRDLVALSAIPTAWIGKEPPAVATGLADALVELLQLDFAFVRLTGPGGAEAVEITRGSAWPSFPGWLARHLAASANLRHKEVVPDADGGSEPCRGLVIPVGFSGDRGLVAAACWRSDFPTPTDELLLSLAANHAATAFQTACAEEALRQARNELETKVAERTAELGQLAEEQAALRHVAVLVARQPSRDEIFTAVTEAVGPLLGADLAAMHAFLGDGTATVIAGWSAQGPILPIGTRLPLDGESVAGRIFETGAAARMDGYEDVEGETAEVARGLRLRSTVGAPIVVEGKLWGALMAATRRVEPLPGDAATRIAAFTELVATAISNAQAREDLRRLADEQAALRRVATLVAQDVPPAELFSAVTKEVERVFSGEEPSLLATVIRFDPGPECVLVGASRPYEREPIGSRWAPKDLYVSTRVLRTRRSARVDEMDLESLGGPDAEVLRLRGFLYQIGSPVVVEGRLWGAMTLNSKEALPPDTDERLENFTELLATAIANAEARSELEQLADEQAALRRVATLVVLGVQPAEIFVAVIEEVGRLFGSEAVTVGRFEHEPPALVAVARGRAMEGIEVGSRWPLDDALASTHVFRTGRSVRVDQRDVSSAAAPVAEALRRLGLLSTVGSPIIVDGRLWGAVTVSTKQTPLPIDAEERLQQFCDVVATAIANAESRSQLAASRRRIVAASDDARRRIERNLHDGTQQRLVSLGLEVRAAEASLPSESSDLREHLSRIAAELGEAVGELQEISRGIHPAILSDGGLGPALGTLARRSALRVDLDIATNERLPEPIEVAAYFVASEAMANATKHAQASRLEISLAAREGSLRMSIRDDGVGGADPTRGSGLVGLADRVEALGGSMRFRSPAGEGTEITAELPLQLGSDEGS